MDSCDPRVRALLYCADSTCVHGAKTAKSGTVVVPEISNMKYLHPVISVAELTGFRVAEELLVLAWGLDAR
jgi:hypothetical protein